MSGAVPRGSGREQETEETDGGHGFLCGGKGLDAGPWPGRRRSGFEDEREFGIPCQDGSALGEHDLQAWKVDGGGKAGFIDEGIAVSLKPGDGIVAETFDGVGWILGMPAEERTETAHGCSGGGDEAGILDEAEVGLAASAFISDIHVEEGTGEVTAFGWRGHP